MKLTIILLMFSSFAFAGKGTTTHVITRYAKFSTMPVKRVNFRSSSSMHRYRMNQSQLQIQYFNKIYPEIFGVLKELRESDSSYIDFDPAYNLVFHSDSIDYAKLSYPLNLNIKFYSDNKSMENIILSISKPINPETLKVTIAKLINIFTNNQFTLKLEKLSKAEELKIPMKYKNFEFYKFQDYFAYYLANEVVIFSDYYSDYKSALNRIFIKKFNQLKSRFLSSHRIKKLVNDDAVQKVQKDINLKDFKDLSDVFTTTTKLPEGFVKREKYKDDISIIYIFKLKSSDPSIIKEITNFIN